MSGRLPRPPLLAITDRRQLPPGRDLQTTLALLVAAGLRWISLREKDLPVGDLRRLLRACRAALGRHEVLHLGLHGSVELYLELADLDLDGLHLPANADVGAARARLGPRPLIGVSCHGTQALAAAAAGRADYATLSPIFPSRSKPGYGPTLGLGALAQAPKSLPVLALGGVTAARLPACLTAGAAGAAVMGPLMRAEDPGRAAAALLQGCEAQTAVSEPELPPDR